MGRNIERLIFAVVIIGMAVGIREVDRRSKSTSRIVDQIVLSVEKNAQKSRDGDDEVRRLISTSVQSAKDSEEKVGQFRSEIDQTSYELNAMQAKTVFLEALIRDIRLRERTAQSVSQ
jgi:hypothetical protein